MTTEEEKNKFEKQIFLHSNNLETVSYDGNNIKEKVLAGLGAFAITGIVWIVSTESWKSNDMAGTINELHSSNVATVEKSVPVPPDESNPYDFVNILGKSAVVYDVDEDKFLYEKNSEKVLPLASVTKLMTALVVYDSVDENKNIAIDPFALDTEGDSGLFANETWRVKDLMDFTLVTSSNDGADALAVAVGSTFFGNEKKRPYEAVDYFVKKMNKKAKDIGMNNTKFSNPTGLDEPEEGGMGTAKDISKLLTFIWTNKPEILSKTAMHELDFLSEDGFLHHAENTNKYVNVIPGLLGGKTGFTDLAGGNLAVVYDAGMNHPIVVVVLGSTLDGRFSDVKNLIDATYSYVETGWYDYDTLIDAD
jgi:D-alanyl-D-alanine carboxypeptidase